MSQISVSVSRLIPVWLEGLELLELIVCACAFVGYTARCCPAASSFCMRLSLGQTSEDRKRMCLASGTSQVISPLGLEGTC